MSVCFKAFGEVVLRALNWGDDSVRRLAVSVGPFALETGADSKELVA